MQHHDRYGNPVSSANTRAIALYDRALDQLNTYRVDPLVAIEQALAEDPSFVMGHCFKAALLTTTSEAGAEPGIAQAVAHAEAAGRHANARERMHMAAARAWLGRDFHDAANRYGDIAVEFPRDLLALQVAHLQDFLLGRAPSLRDRPAQALRAWHGDEPGRGYVLGMHAFGLEECGDYTEAEARGRLAVELEPGDAWAAHAVAHVYEMQGRIDAGINWLEGTSPGWSEGNSFAYHNWWHLALHHLERGDHARALGVYDGRIRVPGTQVAMELVDATALLWRLHLRGVDTGSRWTEVADAWLRLNDNGYYAFNDVHALIACIGAERRHEADRILEALVRAAQFGGTNGAMTHEIGLPVARALLAFHRGDHAAAIEPLARVRAIAHRFGGSHAQRDLLNLTLVEAAVRARRTSLARALAAERAALRPNSPFNRELVRRANALPDTTARAA
jgi:tetratricopeptide (TPR) repeat protein